jgi:pimeloyl-ACP methyl ester carboxylesterase
MAGSWSQDRHRSFFPTRFGRLVIEDAPVPPRDPHDAAVVARHLTSRNILSAAGALRTIALALWRRFDWTMARPVIAALRSPMPDWWSQPARVDMPVLLLGGTASHVPAKRLAHLAEHLPRARVQVLDGSHRLHTEQPVSFFAAALPFLLSTRRVAIASPPVVR